MQAHQATYVGPAEQAFHNAAHAATKPPVHCKQQAAPPTPIKPPTHLVQSTTKGTPVLNPGFLHLSVFELAHCFASVLALHTLVGLLLGVDKGVPAGYLRDAAATRQQAATAPLMI